METLFNSITDKPLATVKVDVGVDKTSIALLGGVLFFSLLAALVIYKHL